MGKQLLRAEAFLRLCRLSVPDHIFKL
jgi:hypothetical protein